MKREDIKVGKIYKACWCDPSDPSYYVNNDMDGVPTDLVVKVTDIPGKYGTIDAIIIMSNDSQLSIGSKIFFDSDEILEEII